METVGDLGVYLLLSFLLTNTFTVQSCSTSSQLACILEFMAIFWICGFIINKIPWVLVFLFKLFLFMWGFKEPEKLWYCHHTHFLTILISYFFKKIYLIERQRAGTQACTHKLGEGQRERKRISSRPLHWVRSQMWGLVSGLDLRRSQSKPKSRVGHSTDWATQASLIFFLF